MADYGPPNAADPACPLIRRCNFCFAECSRHMGASGAVPRRLRSDASLASPAEVRNKADPAWTLPGVMKGLLEPAQKFGLLMDTGSAAGAYPPIFEAATNAGKEIALQVPSLPFDRVGVRRIVLHNF